MNLTFIKSLCFALLAGFAIASCNNDPCKDVACGDFGTCVEGNCNCDPGYEVNASSVCVQIVCPFGFELNAAGVCTEIVCPAGFEVDSSGNCVEISCPAGYEVDANGDCTIFTVSKFIGDYNVTEDCSTSSPATYTSSISATANINEVAINNVWGTFLNNVIATVSGNTITIPEQEPDGDLYFVSGTGELDPATGDIIFNFTVVEKNISGAVVASDVCNNTVYTGN